GAGYFQERPTGVKSARAGIQGSAASPLFPISGGLHARYGFTGWGSAYEGGKTYSLISPEFELDYLLGHSILIGATYAYFKDFGTTPFVFDHKDVSHELRLRYGYLGGRWAYDLGVFYDLERKRAYDTQVSIRRRLDCLEVGVGYSARAQGFGLILNLLPIKSAQTAPS